MENAAFDSSGRPLIDLTDDVHEFIELFNPAATNIDLSGWKISGGVSFEFPPGKVIPSLGFVVIAKDPPRLSAVSAYGLSPGQVLGPWSGKLGNSGDTIRLKDALGNVVDSVSYAPSFPWAIGANALGADDEWTGLVSSNFQYRGRSLERVSASWSGNDPANWLASPVTGNPSPGRSNAVSLAVPRPVVTSFAAFQNADGEPIIRAFQPVRIDCVFSSSNALSGVAVEYFVDDINSTAEAHTTTPMTALTPLSFTVTVPGQADRSIIRYRFLANRGSGTEPVSPRADDPFAWHACFVSPVRSSTNRIYECFISSASLATLGNNIIQNPRRTTLPNPPGTPRTAWNATEPAVFVYNGEVFDIRLRYHGSPFRRAAGRNSFKAQFPQYHLFDNRSSAFITDKTSEYFSASKLYRTAGFPFPYVRWVDWYLNSNNLLLRLEEDEMDDELFSRFENEWRAANPESPREESGEFYKSQGTMLTGDPEGPYGAGTFYAMPARPPYWTDLDRYIWTYAVQMHGWKGHMALTNLCRAMWQARASTNSPNLTALRAYFEANFDVDATLTYLALRQWSCGWDDIFQNYFLWHRESGKWTMLPWDVDSEIGGQTASTSIYIGELGDRSNFWQGPNWLKDSWFKAYRNEFKERLFLLNNTLLNPTNISALGLSNSRSFANSRFASVNSQLALGVFQRPDQPYAIAPAAGQAVLPPALLQSSPYSHSANPATSHASTTWWIRPGDGTYDAPVIKTTSTTSLTSFPIPFDRLEFGFTYYWKCLYTDANGHPSLESIEAPFVFGGETVTVPLIALDATTQWRYTQAGTNQPGWTLPAFDDSAWPQGPALLGSVSGAPEPVRTSLATAPSRITFYFRKAFSFAGDPSAARLRLRHVIDDGVMIYLNGVEVLRTGMPAGSVNAGTLAARNVANPIYEGPFPIVGGILVAGTNVLAAEVHQFNSASTDVAFGLALDAFVPPTPGGVVLSEILADNRGSVTNGDSFPDFVELYNSTAVTQSLNGLSLSDNVLRPGKFIFPAGTSLPPGAYLTVWCDGETNAPGLHTGFALDNDGQTVALFSVTTNGYLLADSVSFGLQAPDLSIGRVPTAGGSWQLTVPTADAVNLAASVGPAATLKINEWMATDANGPDWLEIFNPALLPVALGGLYLTDDFSDPTRSVIPPLSFIAPLGYRQLIADQDPGASARHVDFKLSGSGEFIGLYDPLLAPIDLVSFGPQTAGVSQGRLPDGSPDFAYFPATPTPDDGNYLPLTNVVINEVLAHSDPPLEDWVELYNPTAISLDMSGWWLSDSKSRPQQFQLPANSVLPPHGFLVLYEHQFNTNVGLPFALNGARGDSLYLSAADGFGHLTGYRAGAAFGPAENGVTHGMIPTSRGSDFVALAAPSPGAANGRPRVGPIVISEIMYHPFDFFDGSDNQRDEFIQLHNMSATNVALFDPAFPTNRWRLRDAVDFAFPADTTLAPGESILVVSFDPITNTVALAGFIDTYPALPAGTRLFGPYLGKLENNSDSVELVKPDSPVAIPGPSYGYVPWILADKVHYADIFPWSALADGFGNSLHRFSLSAFGNDPTNWFAAAPTPGLVNVSNMIPLVVLSVPAAFLVGPTNVALTATASDADGTVAQVEFFADGAKLGETLQAPFTLVWTNAPIGSHLVTARARDNAGGAMVSAPVSLHIVSQLTSVALTAPGNGTLFVAGASIPLAAAATNAVTPVTNLEFLVDGAFLSADASAPFTASWITVPGSHWLAAVAVSAGLRMTSAPVYIAVQAVINTNILLVASNSYWSYLDNGTDQGTNWWGVNFPDDGWSVGLAELGYGDTIAPDNKPEATVIGWGPDPNNRYITYYFRLRFILDSTQDIAAVNLGVLRDDGAIAYVNGVEVFRSNMPNGPVNYLTRAPASAAGTDEAIFFPASVDPSRLLPGTNILAIEVHQVTNTSVDMSFSATLSITRSTFGPAVMAQPQNVRAAAGSTVTFTVGATGSAPLAYQWLRNGLPLDGATAPTLVLGNISPADAASYSVMVSNAVGAVTSSPASLVLILSATLQPTYSPASGRFTLRFTADPGLSSFLLASTNLQDWVMLTNFPAGPAAITWDDPATQSVPARFYRIEQH